MIKSIVKKINLKYHHKVIQAKRYFGLTFLMSYIFNNMTKYNRFLLSTVKAESVRPNFISQNTSHVFQILRLA